MLKDFFTKRLKRGLVRRLNNLKIARMARVVARREPQPAGAPVVFFKASTGIDDLSWNSGFHLLASWGFRLRGIPVIYFACHSGMSHCVLGTNRQDVHKAPPCKSCIYQSKTLYKSVPMLGRSNAGQSSVNWFEFQRNSQLATAIKNLSLQELMKFEWQNIPLAALCLPGLRWILRIHHLDDTESTRYLLREYILGPERFDPAFHSYIKTWAYKHPQPTDFFNHMENAAGEELSWFWRGWFYSNKNIDIGIDDVKAEKDGYIITVSNNGGIPLPVVLKINYKDGSSEMLNMPVEIWMRDNVWDHLLKTDKKVKEIIFDPQGIVPDVNSSNNSWKAAG